MFAGSAGSAGEFAIFAGDFLCSPETFLSSSILALIALARDKSWSRAYCFYKFFFKITNAPSRK